MRLTVVGNSGSYPGAGLARELLPARGRARRPHLSGAARPRQSGALGALHTYVDPLTVDAVLLSHLHADHCLDLCGYYVMRKYHPDGPQPQIPVWGPAGAAGRMARAYDLDEDPGMTGEFDFRDYPDGRLHGRAVHGLRPRGVPPGDGLRAAGERRRPHPRLLRRHRPLRRAVRAGGRRRPVPLRGVVPRPATTSRPTST